MALFSFRKKPVLAPAVPVAQVSAPVRPVSPRIPMENAFQTNRPTQRMTLPTVAKGRSGGPAVVSSTERIELPIGMILRRLPQEILIRDLGEWEASGETGNPVSLPADLILAQLPSGRMEIKLEELIQHLPASLLQPTGNLTSYLGRGISLPLMEVVECIPPKLLALRPDQKEVDAAAIEMADPFNEQMFAGLGKDPTSRASARTSAPPVTGTVFSSAPAASPPPSAVPAPRAATTTNRATTPIPNPAARLASAGMTATRAGALPRPTAPSISPAGTAAPTLGRGASPPSRATAPIPFPLASNAPPVTAVAPPRPATISRATVPLPTPAVGSAIASGVTLPPPAVGPATGPVLPRAPIAGNTLPSSPVSRTTIPLANPALPLRPQAQGPPRVKPAVLVLPPNFAPQAFAAKEQAPAPGKAPSGDLAQRPAPAREEAPEELLPGEESSPGSDSVSPLDPAVAVNLNTCRQPDLVGILNGDVTLAQAIIKQREKGGPFRRLEDLLQIPGMTAEAYRTMTGEEPPVRLRSMSIGEILGYPADISLTLKDVTDRILCWPDVIGCVLGEASGLPLVGSVPPPFDQGTVMAFIPRIFDTVNQSFQEITGNHAQEVILPTAGTSFHFFRRGNLYLVILCRLPQMPDRSREIVHFVLEGLVSQK